MREAKSVLGTTRFLRMATLLVLLLIPFVARAQAVDATLDHYLAQTFSDAARHLLTVKDWESGNPGETVEAPGDADANAGSDDSWQTQDRQLQGNWCLRSTAEIKLADGVSVHRTALFYQPLVEQTYNKPLPPLPTESGSALRENGCRLVKILSEFEGDINPGSFAENIGKRLPGKRSEEPGYALRAMDSDYWRPVASFAPRSDSGFYFLYTHRSVTYSWKERPSVHQPFVLLEWRASTLDYGQPTTERTVDPEAGQPWIPLRAAKLAGMPQQDTLAMLEFLSPRHGDLYEQPGFHCERDLVPVLRKWLALAAQKPAEQRAAAVLLADRVAGRLEECDVFIDSSDYVPPEDQAHGETDESLRNQLEMLGIETDRSARPGPEYYTGNLLKEVAKLALQGPVNELYWMAVLDERCQWSSVTDVDCTEFIKQGESFLSHFPNDEWTPSVHLLLAEAYSVTAADSAQDTDQGGDSQRAALVKKAATHFRAWYAKSSNMRDRILVWEEIWGLEAGLDPWLLAPDQLRR
jgi:hypothetical protein